VWAGRGFGVILHSEGGILAVPNPLDRLVIQINMRDLDAIGKRVRFEGKAVILARYFNAVAAAI
jgi:hypothetical protein